MMLLLFSPRPSLLLSVSQSARRTLARSAGRSFVRSFVRLPLAPGLDPIKVSTQVVLVEVTFLYIIGHLALSLAGLLCALELEAVLVHGEAHGLKYMYVSILYPGCQYQTDDVETGEVGVERTLTLSSCSAKHARIRSWKASVGSRVA